MDVFPRDAVPLVVEDPKRQGDSCMDWDDSFRSGVKTLLSG